MGQEDWLSYTEIQHAEELCKALADVNQRAKDFLARFKQTHEKGHAEVGRTVATTLIVAARIFEATAIEIDREAFGLRQIKPAVKG